MQSEYVKEVKCMCGRKMNFTDKPDKSTEIWECPVCKEVKVTIIWKDV